MNCKYVLSHMGYLIDRDVPTEWTDALSNHVARCPHCRRAVEQAIQVHQALRQLPAPVVAADLADRAFARLRASARSKTRHAFAAGFGTALAASMALWLTVAPPWTVRETGIHDVASVTLQVGVEQEVRVAFSAPQAFTDVVLAIELPATVELQGFPGQRRVQWRTSLSAGQNVLTLPLVARSQARGELVATVQTDRKSKAFRIQLEAASETLGRRTQLHKPV